MKIEKKTIKITVKIVTKNNDIYNTGIVTSNGKAIRSACICIEHSHDCVKPFAFQFVKLFMYLWIKYWEQEE